MSLDTYLRARVCPRADANLMYLDQTHLTTYFCVDAAFWPLFVSDVVERVRANPRAATHLHQIGGDRLFIDLDASINVDEAIHVAREALQILDTDAPYAFAVNPTNGRAHVVVDVPCTAAERAAVLAELAQKYPVDVRCVALRLPFCRKRAYQRGAGIYSVIYGAPDKDGDARELEPGLAAVQRMSTYR